jgi:energy-converting hydrogenase Eha subunit G
LAKVVVRALDPVMLTFIIETTLLLMVQGATLAMDLAIMPVLVIPFAALLATTPAIVKRPAQVVGEQFMMVLVVAPTAVMTMHARICEVSLEKDKRLPTSFCTF